MRDRRRRSASTSASGSAATSSSSTGPRCASRQETFVKVEDFFAKTRRQGDLHRPLARADPPADAVHRRRVGHELPPLPSLRRAGRGPLGHDLVPARLHLLAELRAGREHRGSRDDRVRDPGRPVRRRLPGRQAPAPPRAAPGVSRTGSSGRDSARCCGRSRTSCAASGWLLRPVWRYVLRPLWLLVAPPLRFLWARLTPGELGIELTTLATVAAVGIYIVVLQIDLLETDALLPGRQHGARYRARHRVGLPHHDRLHPARDRIAVLRRSRARSRPASSC